jgi:acyl-coenzyme A synthetase/AMP-(fatty) acid ligase
MAGAGIVLTTFGVMTSDFWNVFREQDCTSWAGVPSSFELLKRLDLRKLDTPSLRTLTQAGGTLPIDVAVHFHQGMAERGGRFYVMYGQTEATARMCILPPEMLPEKLGSCGRTMEGGALAVETEVALTNEPGVTGEVVYRGPNVMLGYAVRREDLEKGDELHGTLRTGDLGYLDADGYLFLTGRRERETEAVLARAAP